MPRPNFFIVGAPKSGTTSLYEFLRRHPQVFMPDVKEPVYFGQDLYFDPDLCIRKTIHNLDEYLKLYQDAEQYQRLGDATVWYLYSQSAAREIHDFDPDAKIVIMLRNPVDVMHALHSEFLWNCNEDVDDFREAVELQDQRRHGKQLAATTHFPQGLLYEDIVRYTDQVKRYFDVFGTKRVCVVIFDDVVADGPAAFGRVADYLELDSTDQPDVSRFNAHKPLNFRPVNRFLASRPRLRRFLMKYVISQRVKRHVIERATRLMSGQHSIKPIDPEFRTELQQSMLSDVLRLSDLLDRDLTNWCKAAPPYQTQALP